MSWDHGITRDYGHRDSLENSKGYKYRGQKEFLKDVDLNIDRAGTRVCWAWQIPEGAVDIARHEYGLAVVRCADKKHGLPELFMRHPPFPLLSLTLEASLVQAPCQGSFSLRVWFKCLNATFSEKGTGTR